MWHLQYTQPVLWSSIWHRNFRRPLWLYAFITSLLLRVERYITFYFIDLTVIVYCYVTMVTYLFCNTFEINLWHITLISKIHVFNCCYSVTMVSKIQYWVYPLPYTIYARSTLSMWFYVWTLLLTVIVNSKCSFMTCYWLDLLITVIHLYLFITL